MFINFPSSVRWIGPAVAAMLLSVVANSADPLAAVGMTEAQLGTTPHLQVQYVAIAQGDNQPTDPGNCTTLAQGSFDGGFDGWTVVPTVSESGDAWTFAEAAVVSGVPLYVPMDEDVARLWVGAFAYGADGKTDLEAGAASAQMVITTTATVTQPVLQLTIAGGWEATFFGAGTYSLDAHVEVESSRGGSVIHQISALTLPWPQVCGHGIAVFGILSHREPKIVMDLLEVDGQSTGILLGDDVTIRVVLAASASAAGPCDLAEFTSVVHVDEFAFCGDVIAGDLNSDGAIGGADLALLLGQWGPCPPVGLCQADLNQSGAVDGLDLAILLSAWVS